MTVESRTAIEALRAGVPNRAAIRQMGTEQTRSNTPSRRLGCRRSRGREGRDAQAWCPAGSVWLGGSALANRICSAIWPRWRGSRASWSAALSSARKPLCRIQATCSPPRCATRHCRTGRTTHCGLCFRPARTARGPGRAGNRCQQARCRLRADLRCLPVPAAPGVHAT